MSGASDVPQNNLSHAAEAWLRSNPYFAYKLYDAKTPATAEALLAETNYSPRQIQKLLGMGIVRVHRTEMQRRRESDGSWKRVVGAEYRLTTAATEFIRDDLPDPRGKDGWCVDPDCPRQSIKHEDIPRCKCGAPIRGEDRE